MRRVCCGIVLTLLFPVTASVGFAQSSPPDSPSDSGDQIQSRAISIFGCEISPDVNALRRCLDHKIDGLKGQIDNLRDDIDKIGRTPIMGCRITPNVQQTADCVKDKVDRQVDLQVKIAEAKLNAQLRTLEAQKDAIERQLADLQKNNPMGPLAGRLQKELQALQALTPLNPDSINACMAAAAATQRDIVQLTQRFASNPPGFPPYLIMDIWRQLDTHFDVVMQEELAGLRDSAASGRLPQVDLVLDRSIRALKKLAERDPSAKCVYAAMEPHIPAMKQLARDAQRQIADRAMNLLQTKVLPAILDPVAQHMDLMFSHLMQSDMAGGSLAPLLPNQKELDRIIRGVAAEQLIRPNHVRAVSQKVQALSKSLGTPQAQAALLALQRALDKQEVWPEEVAIQVAMEILRFSGHKWIDSDMPGAGAFTANLAVATMETAKDTVGNVAEAACGVVPEFGGVVCAIFQEMLVIAYDYVSPPAMKIVISNTMHGALDHVINEATKAYLQNYDPKQARQQMGPFASIVNAFPTREVVIAFATRDRSIREMQLALFDYHDSVRQFAETAARR